MSAAYQAFAVEWRQASSCPSEPPAAAAAGQLRTTSLAAVRLDKGWLDMCSAYRGHGLKEGQT
nr:hypothetical protein [uncultured Brevundimonas sp.]